MGLQDKIKGILEYAAKNRAAYNPKNEVINYGNGVLYFVADNGYAHFGKTLSGYISVHPDIKIISIAAYDGSGYGNTIGYFVIVKEGVK